MSENEERIEIQRGLKGVYFDRSKVCFIDGRAGELRYRGYSIHDLAAHSTFEETCYLLLRGELPTRSQLDVFSAELKSARTLPEPVLDVIRIVKDAHPMDVLRTAVSTLSAFDPETADKSTEATLRKGLRLTAQVPMIVTAHERIRHGQTPVAPDPSLGHAANFLYMPSTARTRRRLPLASWPAPRPTCTVRSPRLSPRWPARRMGVRPRMSCTWPRRSATLRRRPSTSRRSARTGRP
jgi:citrate synthase